MLLRVSAALRRVLLIRWQPYMDECIEILETSPDALPSDQTVIRWAKLARLTEDVSFQFSVDDPSSELTVSDPKVLYTLKAFERQLQQWKEDIPPDEYSREYFTHWCMPFGGFRQLTQRWFDVQL